MSFTYIPHVTIHKLLTIEFCPFSDGVGDGQLKMVKEYEIPQMKKAFAMLDMNYDPGFTFIVVQKRINTRLFAVRFSCFQMQSESEMTR